jgi:hypothetical protein
MRPVLGAGAALQRDLVAGSDMAREEVPDGLFLLSCQAWASRISGTRRSTYFLFGAEKRMRRLRFEGLSSRQVSALRVSSARSSYFFFGRVSPVELLSCQLSASWISSLRKSHLG